MDSIFSKTAVLVFIRNDKQEACAKTFHNELGKKGNQRIAKRLNQNIIRKARKSRLPLYVLSGEKQIGNTFGEKLANGFQLLFEKGFEQVIAVGNDCLAVDASLLKCSARQLIDNEVVIGEAKDGGAYLIGLSKKAFQKDTFENLAWETEILFSDLLNYSKGISATYQLLPLANDIDTAQDFQHSVLSMSTFDSLRKIFSSLIAGFSTSTFYYTLHIISSFFDANRPLRAPPIT